MIDGGRGWATVGDGGRGWSTVVRVLGDAKKAACFRSKIHGNRKVPRTKFCPKVVKNGHVICSKGANHSPNFAQ